MWKNRNEKGENLIVSLYKIMDCIEKLVRYKEFAMVLDKIMIKIIGKT